jgi:hypothetical protein
MDTEFSTDALDLGLGQLRSEDVSAGPAAAACMPAADVRRRIADWPHFAVLR